MRDKWDGVGPGEPPHFINEYDDLNYECICTTCLLPISRHVVDFDGSIVCPTITCSSCGAVLDGLDPAAPWRWNGESWEHKCSGDAQCGYFAATIKDALPF
jgi:hypothetical protein